MVLTTDLLHRLGNLRNSCAAEPAPGTAAIEDLLCSENKCCELIDGTLVEKPRDLCKSVLVAHVSSLLYPPTRCQNLGILTGSCAAFVILPGFVRLPDVALVSWDRLPGRRIPEEPLPNVVPDLAVEVLSKSNTAREMARKRSEYFQAGARLVWEIDPRIRMVRVYKAIDQFRDLTANDTLTGDPVLPGFVLPLAQLFAELDRHG